MTKTPGTDEKAADLKKWQAATNSEDRFLESIKFVHKWGHPPDKSPRLEAPPADLRPLGPRGTITKAIGVEPRVQPTMAEERAALEKKWKADDEARLAKVNQGADLAKQLKAMETLANIVLTAAARAEKANKITESLMAKIDQSESLKKGR